MLMNTSNGSGTGAKGYSTQRLSLSEESFGARYRAEDMFSDHGLLEGLVAHCRVS